MTKKKKIILASSISAAVLAVALILTLCLTLIPREKIDLNLSAAQVENEQKVHVEWKTSIAPDQVIIKVKNSSGEELDSRTISSPTMIAKGSIDLDVSYGKHTIEVTARKNNRASTTKSEVVKVYTDEYVIAPLVATMPVTYFSLNIKEYTRDFSVPTFVWLGRGPAWNYENLPENVYLMPVDSYSQLVGYTHYNDMYEKTSKWVKELYEMNPSSTFHLYYNDYHPWGWMQATVANGIPSENYDVTLLSDGTGSYYAFSKYMNRTDSDVVFESMKADYNKLKSQIASKGSYNPGDRSLAIQTEQLRHYVFCMLTEENNVKSVIARNFIGSDMPATSPMKEEFKKLVASDTNPDGKVLVLGLNNLLKNLSDEEQEDLKKLYKFSDNMFEKAAQENKKIMVLMGTSTSSETDFVNYAKATMAYYGDEYVYYYKGHPGYPVQLDLDKAARNDGLGLIDVDSTIAAELIFFFNQEACASGYGSSTYTSLVDEQVCGVWNVALDKVNTEYRDKVDYTITKLTMANPTYGVLATSSSYLFEFKDKSAYDCAVYDADRDTLKFYKLTDSLPIEVQR